MHGHKNIREPARENVTALEMRQFMKEYIPKLVARSRVE
jgi:hypothetical protein